MVIKAFLFDLGDVIVNLEFKQFTNDIILQSPLIESNPKNLLDDFWRKTSRYDLGYISEEQFYILSREFLKVHQISKSMFLEAFNSVIAGINQELVNYIQKLKQENKYRIVMLSNVNPTHWEYCKNNFLNFLHLFDELLLSFELHMAKPDLNIFKHAINVCSCNADEIIYIDDREENIQAARSLGINTIRYLNTDQLMDNLRTLNIYH